MMIPGEFLERARFLFDAMEKAYDEVASHYGFGCGGCKENCCTQRFHHHTLVECLFLKEGIVRADIELARKILLRTRVVVDSYARELEMGQMLPLMCPVNSEGLCTLYAYRPMICRVHGLPHRFTRPDGASGGGGGCRRFEEMHEADRLLDRTWAYTELAYLERDLRLKTNFRQRIKMTTAEVIMWLVEHDEPLMGRMED